MDVTCREKYFQIDIYLYISMNNFQILEIWCFCDVTQYALSEKCYLVDPSTFVGFWELNKCAQTAFRTGGPIYGLAL